MTMLHQLYAAAAVAAAESALATVVFSHSDLTDTKNAPCI